MRSLICACDIHMQQRQVFSRRGPFNIAAALFKALYSTGINHCDKRITVKKKKRQKAIFENKMKGLSNKARKNEI